MPAESTSFIGSTTIPNDVLDKWLSTLNGSELKVILYVVRHTNGFAIKDRQFSTREIARGTGLKKNVVKLAMRSLLINAKYASLFSTQRLRMNRRRPYGGKEEPPAG